MKDARVAIVGATGAVGRELLAVLEQRDFPLSHLRLLASSRKQDRRLGFRGEKLRVETLGAASFTGIDLALFSAGRDVSLEYGPRAVAAGAVVIDNSSAFRMDQAVPLVVPEWNAETMARHRGILANPNCSTIILVMALAPLHRAAGLRSVVVSTYQAASGAGRRAVEEMRAAARACLEGTPYRPGVLPASLGFNVFPQVDAFAADGYTLEENKMRAETAKILDLTDLELEATCVRVPVERCHAEAVTVALQRPLGVEGAREVFETAPGLEVRDRLGGAGYPQPIELAGRDEVAVGRIRESRVFAPGLTFWLVGDQLRKGAALNAVQIAERL